MHLPPPIRHCLLLAMVVVSGIASAAQAAVIDPVVDTSWDVRRDADELLEDLKKRSSEPAQLLERVAAMLAANGDRLISAGTVFAPISEVLLDKLREIGLQADFE